MSPSRPHPAPWPWWGISPTGASSPLPVTAGQPLTLRLPRGAWVEYAWLDAAGEAFADPDNPQKSLNPWWPYPRAAVVGEYARHPLWLAPESTRKGTATRLSWEGGVFPGTRRAIVYTPHGYVSGTPCRSITCRTAWPSTAPANWAT